MRKISDIEVTFQELRDSLEKKQGTSDYLNSIKPISGRFVVMKREFSNLFGMKYKELISILLSLKRSNIKVNVYTLDDDLEKFLTGSVMESMKTKVSSALKEIHSSLRNIASNVNSNKELQKEDISLIRFNECIASIKKFKPNLMQLLNEMIAALSGEDVESDAGEQGKSDAGVFPMFSESDDEDDDEDDYDGDETDPLAGVKANFAKWYEEFSAMRREGSKFNSIKWFDSLVSVSKNMIKMMSSMIRVFRYQRPYDTSRLKRNPLAAEHLANIKSTWYRSIYAIHSLYERLSGVYGGDAMILMRKIRNIDTVPTPEQTERLNDLFKLFDSLPNSFGYSFEEYEHNLLPMYKAFEDSGYDHEGSWLRADLRRFEEFGKKIDQLSIRDNQFLDSFVNGFRKLVTEWDQIVPSSNAGQ